MLRKRRITMPDRYRDLFNRSVSQENIFRILVTVIILIFSESMILLFLRDSIANAGRVVLWLDVFNIVMLPAFAWAYSRGAGLNLFLSRILQWIYLSGMLAFGCALAVVPQGQVESIHIYIMVVFAIAAFIHLEPLETAILFFSAYLAFFLAIDRYQTSWDAVVIYRLNAFMLNGYAWVFSRMVCRMRIISFLDEKTIQEQNQQLREMAMRDGMTSLLNHAHTVQRLHEEMEKADNSRRPLSIIIIDIDDFKKVNDQHGHLAGDRIIVQVAEILVRTCRADDVIGRYGGEEFFIILPDTPQSVAAILAERIRAAVAGTEFENGLSITVSGGIREYGQESAEELVRSADEQLYQAKKIGKNRFVIHQSLGMGGPS